jgi:uncharacterized membrane protein
MPQTRPDREEQEEHADDNPALSNVVERNIRTIIALHAKSDRDRSSHDRIADFTTALSGRMVFVYGHVVWFGVWILLNSGHVGTPAFDPFPYGLLNTIVTLEAIVVTTLVLISQKRLSDEAKQRTDLDLQMGLLTEHELTRVLKMLDAIQRKVGVTPNPDGSLADLVMETRPEDVLAELERLENRPLARKTPAE